VLGADFGGALGDFRVSRHGCGQGEGPIAVLSRAFQR
jgi:hypothetical protein